MRNRLAVLTEMLVPRFTHRALNEVIKEVDGEVHGAKDIVICDGLALLHADADGMGELERPGAHYFQSAGRDPRRGASDRTYIFRGFDPPGIHQVIQVFLAGDNSPIAALEALPVYRRIPLMRPVITFEESSANNPEAVHEIFFRNEN